MGVTCYLTQILFFIFLGGDDTLVPLIEEKNLIISIITEIEILGYEALRGEELIQTKRFLNHCSSIGITSDIKEKAISIHRKYKIKLPDAIIAATSVSLDVPIITADNDFKKVKNSNLIFYER